MFIKRLFKSKQHKTERWRSTPAPVQREARPADLALGQWAERQVRRMSLIFAAQGYTGARVGRLIRGTRHVVVPVIPSESDIAKNTNLRQKWLALAENVGMAAGVRSYAEWDAGRIYYFLQLPGEYWRHHHLDDLAAPDAIGQTEYRRAIRYEFTESHSHALLAGATGSGKSVAIETIIFALARAYTPDKLGFIIIDPHHSFGLRPERRVGSFDNLAHLVMPVARRPAEIETAWRWAYTEMARRMTLQQAEGHIGEARRIVIVADELAAESVLGRKGANHEANLVAAKTLGAEARKLRMNLVLGTQKPGEVDHDLFDHLTYRFGGLVTNNNLGTRILGRPGYKLAELSGAGDFIVSAKDVRRFQFALPTRADFEALPRAEIAWPMRGQGQVGLGRVPVQTPAPLAEVDPLPALLQAEGTPESKGGAPYKCPDPEKIAYYLYYQGRRGAISIADAQSIAALQLSRAMHDRHHEAARLILATLQWLVAEKKPLAELERIQ